MRLLGSVIILSCVLLFIGTSAGCKKKAPPPEAVEAAKVEDKKPEPPPPPKKEEKPEAKELKERQGVVYNVHMAAHRPETQNDFKQIGTYYQADLATGMPWTTLKDLKNSMGRQAAGIVKKIDEGIYKVNLKGKKLQNSDILAWEYEQGSPAGFCVVRASGEIVTDLPYDELKKELGFK